MPQVVPISAGKYAKERGLAMALHGTGSPTLDFQNERAYIFQCVLTGRLRLSVVHSAGNL
jgi:hypothetical protein